MYLETKRIVRDSAYQGGEGGGSISLLYRLSPKIFDL